MKKNKILGLLALLLSLVLLVGLGTAVFADGEGGTEDPTHTEVESNGLVLEKSATVRDDGSYDIELDAYATGEVTIVEKTIPADIVLVLDVSGSMSERMSGSDYAYVPQNSQGYSYSDIEDWFSSTYYYLHTDGNYYQVRGGGGFYNRNLYFVANNTTYYLVGNGVQTNPPSGYDRYDDIWTGVLYEYKRPTKLEALKIAVNSFIDSVAKSNKGLASNVQSRVSIVKFAGSAYQNYANYVEGNHSGYTEVFKDLGAVTEDNKDTWKANVGQLVANGETSADFGMGYANAVFNKHASDSGISYTDRQKVVVMFTDGEPNHGSGFNNSVAAATINASKGMKDNKVTVYTVAVISGANPALDPEASGTSKINKYLHAVSSNYPTATATGSNNSLNITWYAGAPDRPEGSNYYLAASDAESLNNIFKSIAEESGGSSTTLESAAVMKDIVSHSFTLPAGATKDDIAVNIIPWDFDNNKWSTTKFTPAQWAGRTNPSEEISVTVDGDTVDVTGFDYSKHFLDVKSGTNKDAAKIQVSFHVFAKPSSITGSTVKTNGEDSGIYKDAKAEEAVVKFKSPEVEFLPEYYVIDYVNAANNSVELDYKDVLANVQMLDEPDDDILQGKALVGFNYIEYKANYGKVYFGASSSEASKKAVTYTPYTTKWDGYDRIFVKGQSKTDNEKNVWAMLVPVPANNVFYEDNFITTSETIDEGVTIEYTGITYSDGWVEQGDADGNQTGWTAIDGRDDDTADSDGQSHLADGSGNVSFTFTGTGVDIYSRTNLETGTITALLTGYLAADTDKKNPIAQVQIISNKANSGDFYQIPTCTFTDLEYGTYTVTITVTKAAQNNTNDPTAAKRTKYYLDGVRVYNPIRNQEGDENVKAAYTENGLGLNARFVSVHELLLTETEKPEAVFIDENGDHVTSNNFEDFEVYGPKSEVYLAGGQSIAISVDALHTYAIGLHSIDGSSNEVAIGDKTVEISSSADLFYKAEPIDGIIRITNNGTGKIGVTKIRITNAVSTPTLGTTGLVPATPDKFLTSFRTISAMPLVPYEEEVEEEEPVVEDNEGEASDDVEVVDLDEGSIIITPAEDKPAETVEPSNSATSYLQKLFDSFKRFFRL